jgi:hypothetical protein
METFLEYLENNILMMEKVINNHMMVTHRSPNPVEFYDIWDTGIQARKNLSDAYGKGLYTVYSAYNDNTIYGDYILRGSVKIDNFGIFEKDIYDKVDNHGDGSKTFNEHLLKMGVNLNEYSIEEQMGYSSDNAQNNWKSVMKKGYDGIIFHGRKDGYVCVIWEQGKHCFIPHSYINGADGDGNGDYRFRSGNEEGVLLRKIHNTKIWEGDLNLNGTNNIKTFGDVLMGIDGNLVIMDVPIESLGNLRYVSGDVVLKGCKRLGSLGKLSKVKSLYMQGSLVGDLGMLTNIQGSCNLRGSGVKDLGDLRDVGGYLNVSDTPIESIINLKFVGGFINLKNTDKLGILGTRPDIVGRVLYDEGSKTEMLLHKFGWI